MSTWGVPSHKYQLYSAMLCPYDRKRCEDIVFNRHNFVTKLSIYLAFGSKKKFFLNSSCHYVDTHPHWEKSNICFPVQPIQQSLFHLEIFWVCIDPKAHMHKLKLKKKEQDGLEEKKKVNLNDFHTVLCRTAIYLHGFIHLFNSLPSTGLLTKSPAHFISIYILLSASLAWALY